MWCWFGGGWWPAGSGLRWLSISRRNSSPSFAGSGDGDARERRTLSWKRRFGVVLLPAALAPEGILGSAGSGDEGVSTSSSFLGHRLGAGYNWRLVEGGIFAAVDGGIFVAWLPRWSFRGR